MKIFVSWSGERSKEIASLLREWIPNVLQHTEVWFSPDMDRGSVWFTDICSALADSSIGIVCLTRENLNSPWILFEAGALAKGMQSNRVSPLLIDLSTTDLSTPLSLFNATSPTKESMFSLIKTINAFSEDNMLDAARLETSFNAFWPAFEEKFRAVLERTQAEVQAPITKTTDEVLEEILGSVQRIERNMSNTGSAKIAYRYTPSGIEGIDPATEVDRAAIGKAFIDAFLSQNFKQEVAKVAGSKANDTPVAPRHKYSPEPT